MKFSYRFRFPCGQMYPYNMYRARPTRPTRFLTHDSSAAGWFCLAAMIRKEGARHQFCAFQSIVCVRFTLSVLLYRLKNWFFLYPNKVTCHLWQHCPACGQRSQSVARYPYTELCGGGSDRVFETAASTIENNMEGLLAKVTTWIG